MVKHQVLSRAASLVKKTQGMRIVDLAISYDCNLACAHCSASRLKQNKPLLDLDDYRDVVAQAERMDNLSFNITGGEPLLSPILDALIPLLKPEKHYISIQTNGMLLSRSRAEHLAGLGVNCITTSLDSPYRVCHNRFRGSSRSFDAVFESIAHARSAGMQVLVGTTVTHGNLRSAELKDLIRLVNKAGAICLFNLAVPCGNWTDNNAIVLRESDRAYLIELMDEFPATSTDHEPGRNGKGCPAAMEKIYITPYGDVFPCPFIHVSFGNVRERQLKDMVSDMRNVPCLQGYPGICVAAEDTVFHRQILLKSQGRDAGEQPLDYRDVF